MEIISDLYSQNFLLPLPIYKTIKIADAKSKDGENFSIFVGLDKKMITQLENLSLDKNDTELQKNTSDLKRFGGGLYENWYRKNRTPFALIHNNTNKLAALVWFGPDPLIENESVWHTIAWRSYPDFRGKGLIKKFVSFSIDVYSSKNRDIKLWAGINMGNIASEKVAESLGFKIFEKLLDTQKQRLIMVKY